MTSSEVTILNPVYLQLSQELALVRVTLVGDRREAEILQDQTSSLQGEIDQLSETVVSAKSERNRLDRTVLEVTAQYEPAREELDRLLDVERRTPQLARPAVVNEAQRPNTPIAPRKAANISISGILAIIGGVVIALIIGWYRSGHVAETLPQRGAATARPKGDA